MQYAMCVQLCVSLIARRLATSHETHLLHVTQGCGARSCKCSAVHRCFRRHCRVNRQYSDVHSGLHTMHVSLTTGSVSAELRAEWPQSLASRSIFVAKQSIFMSLTFAMCVFVILPLGIRTRHWPVKRHAPCSSALFCLSGHNDRALAGQTQVADWECER